MAPGLEAIRCSGFEPIRLAAGVMVTGPAAGVGGIGDDLLDSRFLRDIQGVRSDAGYGEVWMDSRRLPAFTA